MNKCKIKACQLFITIVVTMILSGCGRIDNNVSLMSTPKSSKVEQEKLREALNKFLPKGYEFATAKKSNPKQAIFFEDLNHDNNPESIILYRDTINNKPVHIIILEEKNGILSRVSDVSTRYNYLDYFNIKDLDGDGKKEIIIGVGISDTEPSKQLYIYELTENHMILKVEATYEWIDINDYDGDNKQDILLLNGEVNKDQHAVLFHYNKGKLEQKSTIDLNSDAYHENIVGGKLSDGKQAVFIDSGVGAHSMLTEIVAYNKGKLSLIGNEDDGVLLKEYPLYSKDINKDGVIEVGGMEIPKGYEDAAMAEIPFIYTYNDYNIDGTKQMIQQRYYDNRYHFYITIPKEWYNKVTIRNVLNGILLVSAENRDILFELNWVDKDAYDGTGIKLGENQNKVFYTTTKENMPIPRNNFHFLSEDLE